MCFVSFNFVAFPPISSTLKTEQPIGEQRRLLPLRRNDLLAQSSTETLLEMLKSHAGIKDCSEETVLHINGVCSILHSFSYVFKWAYLSLKRCLWMWYKNEKSYWLCVCVCLSLWFIVSQILIELYTRIGIEHNDWRSSILSSLYGLVECTSATILLSVARVVLVVKIYTPSLCVFFFFSSSFLIHLLFLFSFGRMIHFHSIYI